MSVKLTIGADIIELLGFRVIDFYNKMRTICYKEGVL
jgi:hypothetical protein